MPSNQTLNSIYKKYTEQHCLTETKQKQMLIELGYFPFDAPLINSVSDLEKLLEGKEKFDKGEVKNSIKNIFGSQVVSRDVLLGKLVSSGVLGREEEEEFRKLHGEEVDLDLLVDTITM